MKDLTVRFQGKLTYTTNTIGEIVHYKPQDTKLFCPINGVENTFN